MASTDGNGGAASQGRGIPRQDIQAAIAKAVELRALHASLLQGSNAGSPAVVRFPVGASPSLSRGSTNNLSAPEEYPVFTPSYEEDPLPGYHYLRPDSRSLTQVWSAIGGLEGGTNDDEAMLDNKSVNKLSTFKSEHICSAAEQLSSRSSYLNHMSLFQGPGAETLKSSSMRTSPGEYKVIATCNACKPASINREIEGDPKNFKIVPRTDPPQSVQLHAKNRGPIISWLFPKSKKKLKPEALANTIEPENMSQLLKDWGALSLESLKKELLEANENKDAALAEVSEMKSSLGEMQQKLVSLEAYCEELKRALKQAMQVKSSQVLDKANLSKRMKSISSSKDSWMPVSHEVMVEGFLQIVSEARLSVKQFCKTLVHLVEEADEDLEDKINLLLEPYQLTMSNKSSKGVLYHLESLVNQSLYQDFENCVFQKSGSPKFLDPQRECQEDFAAFVALRNLSWNEVLRKGTKYYSEDFSRFCDQKMSCIVSLLNWSRPWPEQLLQCFFVAAKCIWLLHLLAFSFNPHLTILRVNENRNFDPVYMEDALLDRHRPQGLAQVKIMIMPGFYVQDRVLKCRVLCRYPSVVYS